MIHLYFCPTFNCSFSILQVEQTAMLGQGGHTSSFSNITINLRVEKCTMKVLRMSLHSIEFMGVSYNTFIDYYCYA